MVELSEGVFFIQESPESVLRLGEELKRKGDVVFLQGKKKVFLSKESFLRLAAMVEGFLQSYHESHPSQKGAPSDETALHALQSFDSRTARAFLEVLTQNGTVVMEEGLLRMADFTPRDDEAFEKNARLLLAFCKEREYQPPLLSEAQEYIGVDEKMFSILVKGMREAGMVSIVSGEFLFSLEIEAKLLQVLLKQKDNITLARIRDLTGSSRKFILPLLEYFDAKGYTRRVEGKRVLLTSKLPVHIVAAASFSGCS